MKLYEAWINTDAGSLTTTVVTVTAANEREAFRKVQADHPGQLVRGVIEVGADD